MELKVGMKFEDMDKRDGANRKVEILAFDNIRARVRNVETGHETGVKLSSFYPAGTSRKSGFVHLPGEK